MKYRLLIITALIFLGVTPALAHETASSRTVTIHMTPSGFEPETVELHHGDQIIFENADARPRWPASNIHPTHTVYPGSDIMNCDTDQEAGMFDACRGISPGETWSFVFNEAGTWKFHDHLAPEFNGTIVVTGGGDTAEQPNILVRIFHAIKDWFARLFDHFRREPTEILPAVTRENKEMFTDELALKSYINTFGVSTAIARLHELTSEFGDCHQAAHKAGRIAFELTGEEAFRECRAECHSGCYHGATEAFFRDHGTENIAENLGLLCNSELNAFFNHQCIHGIGHGLMAWADYDIFEALRGCDELPTGHDSCYTGVFMENIVGGLAADGATEEQKQSGHITKYLNSDPHYPCPIVPDQYKPSCYFYQTSRMVQLFDWDFRRVAASCSQAPETYQSYCFQSMGRDVGAYFRGRPAEAIAACNYAPAGALRVGCLNGAVQDSFWDPSGQHVVLSFCSLLVNSEEKDGCYHTIFDRATQLLTDPQTKENFCGKAESSYQALCHQTLD